MWDIYNRYIRVPLKSPIDAVKTAWKSYVIDLEGFEGASFEVETGSFTGEDASNYLTVTLYDYTPASTLSAADAAAAILVTANYTLVTAAKMQGSYHAINAAGYLNIVQKVGYIGVERYVFVNGAYTTAGTYPNAGIVSASVVLGPLSKPLVITPTSFALTS